MTASFTNLYRFNPKTLQIFPLQTAPQSYQQPNQAVFTNQSDSLVTYTSDVHVVEDWIKRNIPPELPALSNNNKNRYQKSSEITPNIQLRPLGVDLEWRANRSATQDNPPALLQLSANNGSSILLFQMRGCAQYSSQPSSQRQLLYRPAFKTPHLHRSPRTLSLHNLLSAHGNFVRVGCNIKADFTLLTRHYGLSMSNTARVLDLTVLARRHYRFRLERLFGSEFVTHLTKHQNDLTNTKTMSTLRNLYQIPKIEFVDPVDISTSSSSSSENMMMGINVEECRRFLEYLDSVDMVAIRKLHSPQQQNISDSTNITPSPESETPQEQHIQQEQQPTTPYISDQSNTPIVFPVPPLILKTGLEALTKRYLNIQISKSRSISCSNWEWYPLDERQLIYAAMDAWSSECVYTCIINDLLAHHNSSSATSNNDDDSDKDNVALQILNEIFNSK